MSIIAVALISETSARAASDSSCPSECPVLKCGAEYMPSIDRCGCPSCRCAKQCGIPNCEPLGLKLVYSKKECECPRCE